VTVRRRTLLCFGFLVAAVLLASADSARAQRRPLPPGQHDSITGSYTPEQVKAALERFGQGGLPRDFPPELFDFLKRKMEREGNQKIDEKQLKQALEMMKRDPALQKQMEELGKKFRSGGKNTLTEDERKQLEKMIPNGGLPPGPQKGGLPPLPPDLKKFDPPPLPRAGEPVPPPNAPMAPMPNAGPVETPPRLDPNPALSPNPFDQNETPRDKAAHAAASLWERNIGPLDDNPTVKKALFDLVEGTEDIRDEEGNNFWESLAKESGNSTPLFDFLDGAAMSESWSRPNLDFSFGKWGGSDRDAETGSDSPRESWWQRNFGNRRPPTSSTREPSSSSGSSGSNFVFPGLEGSWWPVVVLVILVLGSLLVWQFWGWKQRAAAGFGLGGHGWPIDPRRITTREHVVIAFEYLSVLICGPTAKTWTHNTIAEALADLAATHAETAVMLARLYELARYAPLEEPMTTAELAEARRLVCTLAGLEHE
jgi:hypothetical protein